MMKITVLLCFLLPVHGLRFQWQSESESELSESDHIISLGFMESDRDASVLKVYVDKSNGLQLRRFETNEMSRTFPDSSQQGYNKDWYFQFASHIFKDLSETQKEGLQKCKQIKMDKFDDKKGKTGKLPGGADVWIAYQREDRKASALHYFGKSKVVVLGNGYNDNQLEANLTHSKAINIWMPYAITNLFTGQGLDFLSPMEFVNRENAREMLASKDLSDRALLFMNNECSQYRQQVFDDICEGLQSIGRKCHYAAACKGTKSLGDTKQFFDPVNGRMGTDKMGWEVGAIQTYSKFAFTEAVDHIENDYGYISEKITLPFLAGSIPIYRGASHASKIFNPKAFIDARNSTAAISTVNKLLQDRRLYEEMVLTPSLTDDQMREYMTWHSDTWPKYGDRMRQRIVDALITVCSE